jgi:excisionase family DNA binding protein
MTQPLEEPHVTTAEAAAQIGCSVRTVRRWIKDRQIPGVIWRTGKYRIPESSVRRMIENGTPRGTA